MFNTPALPFIIARATLKIEPNEDGVDRRVADLSLVMEPFPHAIAAEMDFSLHEHLFTSSQQIRPELETVTLDPRAPLQRVTVQSAPDAPSLATLTAARVLELKVTKKEDSKNGRLWLKAALLVQIDLGERAVREFLFHHFGEIRCFTFLPEQLDLHGVRGAVGTLQSGLTGGIDSMEITSVQDGRRKGVRITKDDITDVDRPH